MSQYLKRRNLGLLLALAALVMVAILGSGAHSSSQVAASVAPAAGPHQAARPIGQQPSQRVASATNSQATKLSNGVIVVSDEKHDTSIPLRDMKVVAPMPRSEKERANENLLHGDQTYKDSNRKNFSDPVLQKSFGPLVMPTPIITFEGLGANGSIPPDTTGDVGPNHYVQWINTQFAIYNKTGTRLAGPFPGNQLWSGFGGACQNSNDGDPIVLYDQMADRWFMSQFAFPNFPSGPFYQCIAVSQTGDPQGAWHRYAFVTSQTKLNDYPHFGIWPDGYYMTANLFQGANFDWAGTGNYVFDRSRMLQGQTATMQLFELGPEDWGGMLPSDVDGTTLPPAGAPNTFIEVNADEWSFPPYTYRDELQIWQFHVDWQTPANTTFTGPVLRPVAAFDGMACANFARTCVRQPGTAQRLDAITDRGLFRLAYRNFGTHESLVLNHTVDADGTNNGYTGVRWYEVRSPRNNPTIFQQGTYAPDATSRWMGSAAMDRNGNFAVGYSVSDATSTYPGIRYAGRLVGDPLGQLSQGEAVMQPGNGSQTGYDRWGDYSSLTLDPTDDCTFWYTTEYYQTSSAGGFRTRIGSFKFPSCTAGTPLPTNTPGGATATRSSTPPATSTATPTQCGAPGGWAAGPSLPTAHVRGVGVWYANGLNRFYVMGGRSADTAGSDLQNPRYFDPASSTWTVDSAATLPDNQVNNMACADLNGPSGHGIYCVGGSAAGATTATGRVVMYDPNAHTITALSSDNWPATANTLPGGFAVVGNKLYILGGFTINVSMSRQIWQFDPMAAAGSRWTLKTAQVPDPGSGSNGLGYIPAAAVGNVIYTGGGSFWDPSTATIADHALSFSYNTATDTVSDSAVPDMPAPGSAETRAVNVGGKIWVIGGGRTTPNPSAAVQQFDPANPGAGWTTVNSFSTARRNFPVDIDPATGKIYLGGGYAPTAATATMEIYSPPAGCGTNTPVRTNTATFTAIRTFTVVPSNTVVRTNTSTRTNTPGQGTATWTPMRTNTPQRTGTPCVGCSMEMLAVVTSCYMDGTVHWIAIAHNPDNCGMMAPWRAELQVRNNGGNFRVVRIQYATSYFRSGDSIMDGFFCYHFSSNVRDVRVEYLFEEQDGVRGGVSKGSKEQVQEKAAPANTYSTTPDSGIPTGDSRSNPSNPNSPTCDAAMASRPMVPCQNNDGCGGGPPTPPPTGVPTRAPALPNK